MRLPWISIDADGQTRGRLLGRLLGVNEHQGVGMAIGLWQAAVEFSRDGDFRGEVPSVEFLAAACGWPIGDAGRLAGALQQVGLVATHPQLRVRGLDRYRRTWEKNSNYHRNLASSRRQVPSTGALTAKTGTQDEDEDEERKDFLAPEPPKPTKKPRKLSAAEEFFAWLTARRLERTKNTDAAHTVAALNAIFGRALVDVGRPALERAYLAYLDEPDGASQEPPWPWRGFAARYATLARRSAATPLSESRAL